MGGAVFSQTDGVVGIDHNLPRLHQRCHARRVTGVLDEHQEGGGVGYEAAVVGDAVGDRGHPELAHAVVDIVPGNILLQRFRARPDGQVTRCQVRRAAQQLRKERANRIQGVLRRLTGGDFCRVGLQVFNQRLGFIVPVLRQTAAHAPGKLGGQLRVRFFVGGKLLVPGLLGFLTVFTGIPRPVDLFRDLKRRVFPAQLLPGQRHFFVTQRRAVRLFFARLVRRAEADNRAADNQGRFVLHALRFLNRFFHRLRIVAVDLVHHVPVVGLEAFCRVVGEPALGFPVDGDAVVIVEANQLAEPQGARQGADLMGNPLHQAAVTHKHVGVVIDNLVVRLVELCRQRTLGNRQPDRICQPLTERPGGGFHARRIANLRVPRGFGVQLAEVFQLLKRQIVTGQVQQAVEQHRGVAVGENKAVTVVPGGIVRVVLQEVVPQHFGNIGHAHRCAGMARIGFLHGIHAEGADGIGELFTGHSSLRGKVKVWQREDLQVCAGRRRTGGYLPPVFPRPWRPDCAPSGIRLRSWFSVLAER